MLNSLGFITPRVSLGNQTQTKNWKFGLDHVSWLENNDIYTSNEHAINDFFLKEKLYCVQVVREEELAWFIDIVNYLATGILPK